LLIPIFISTILKYETLADFVLLATIMKDKNIITGNFKINFTPLAGVVSICLALFFALFTFHSETQARQSPSGNNDNKNSESNSNTNASPVNTNTNSASASSSQDNASGNQNTERVSNLNETLDQKMKDLSEIESKIQTYGKLVEMKQSEQKTLNNQIGVIDNQIEQTKEEIKKSQKDIEITDIEIQQLELKISEQTESLKQKQTALKVLLNELYRKDEKDMLEVLLSYSGISSFIQEIAYTEQANQRVFNKLQEINSLRKDLELKQQVEKEKHDMIKTEIEKKNDRTAYLQGEQDSRETLLSDTQGEEERYQGLLKRFEEEKQTLLGDLDELSASKSSEMDSTRSHQPKPTSGLASTDWYFSQRDSRWGASSIGFSNTKMSKYGCAVTCVSMILRYHGVEINPGILAHQPIFSNDLIVWPDQWQFVKRIGGYSHGNINWDTVDKEIADHNPVIVFVRANGRGAGHYVVVHHKDNNGKYVVHDPYWGSNIYLDSTRENISVLYGSSTSVDQMIIYHSLKRSGEYNPPPDNPVANVATNANENKNSPASGNSNKNSNANGNSNKNKNNK